MTLPTKINIRRVLLFSILLALISVGYYSFAPPKTTQFVEDVSTESNAVPVRVAQAEIRTLTPTVEVIGLVQPDPQRYSIVSSATSGLVEKLLVNAGTHVAKNDPVVQLDNRQARTALDRAEATYARLIAKPRPEELQEAQGLVDKAQSAYTAAESRVKKAQDIRARNPELVPEIDLLTQQRDAEAAKADWESAQAQLQLLKLGPRDEVRRESQVDVEAAKLQLDYYTVRAPISGEVVTTTASIGQRADMGTPLVTILDSSVMLVQSRIPSDQLAGVQSVMNDAVHKKLATIHCLSFPNERFTASAGWLGDQTEAQTSDVPIYLRVANTKGLLRIGMTVQAQLYEQPVEGITIPDVAVTVNELGHHVVTVVREGKAIPTEITISSENQPVVKSDGWIRVLSGLQPGDLVAIENGYDLPQDTPVKILPPATTPDVAAGPQRSTPSHDEPH